MLTGFQGSQLNVFLIYTLITRLPESAVQRLRGVWIMFSTSGRLCLTEACLSALIEAVCDLLAETGGTAPFDDSTF